MSHETINLIESDEDDDVNVNAKNQKTYIYIINDKHEEIEKPRIDEFKANIEANRKIPFWQLEAIRSILACENGLEQKGFAVITLDHPGDKKFPSKKYPFLRNHSHMGNINFKMYPCIFLTMLFKNHWYSLMLLEDKKLFYIDGYNKNSPIKSMEPLKVLVFWCLSNLSILKTKSKLYKRMEQILSVNDPTNQIDVIYPTKILKPFKGENCGFISAIYSIAFELYLCKNFDIFQKGFSKTITINTLEQALDEDIIVDLFGGVNPKEDIYNVDHYYQHVLLRALDKNKLCKSSLKRRLNSIVSPTEINYNHQSKRRKYDKCGKNRLITSLTDNELQSLRNANKTLNQRNVDLIEKIDVISLKYNDQKKIIHKYSQKIKLLENKQRTQQNIIQKLLKKNELDLIMKFENLKINFNEKYENIINHHEILSKKHYDQVVRMTQSLKQFKIKENEYKNQFLISQKQTDHLKSKLDEFQIRENKRKKQILILQQQNGRLHSQLGSLHQQRCENLKKIKQYEGKNKKFVDEITILKRQNDDINKLYTKECLHKISLMERVKILDSELLIKNNELKDADYKFNFKQDQLTDMLNKKDVFYKNKIKILNDELNSTKQFMKSLNRKLYLENKCNVDQASTIDNITGNNNNMSMVITKLKNELRINKDRDANQNLWLNIFKARRFQLEPFFLFTLSWFNPIKEICLKYDGSTFKQDLETFWYQRILPAQGNINYLDDKYKFYHNPTLDEVQNAITIYLHSVNNSINQY